MRRSHNASARVHLVLIILTGLLLGCVLGTPRGLHADVGDKWDLWTGGPHLRGANTWQAIVISEVDGLEFKGPGPVGPPYSQEDFYRLAAMGANYVSISGPGLFTESPPYTVDLGVQDHLDSQLAMIAKADMFATIGFRTGPERSEFSNWCEDPWCEDYVNDSMWENQAAQDAWVEMWRYTAERYRDNPIVAGYKLMNEPNASAVLLDMYEPDEFYADYAGTLYDWNQLHPRIVAGIREVDPNTPILVSGPCWSGVRWFPYLQPTDDPRTVYVVHQYEPQGQYTHQEPDGENTYPGVFDTNWDGEDDQFDRAWLDNLLSTVDTFMATHGMPVAVGEYGVARWVPGGAEYMDDQMDLFEQRGMNYALWEWQTSWEPFAEEVHSGNFRLGPDPDNRVDVASSELMDVIRKYWGRNTIRPSIRPTVVSEEEIGQGELPRQFALEQSYPNPFNASTTIRYRLAESRYVKLAIYNLGGQEMRVLVSEIRPAGHHHVSWGGRDEDGRLAASGMYLYRLEAGKSFVQARKTLLIR